MGIFRKNDHLFIPFYLRVDTQAKGHEHYSEERYKFLNRALFDTAERNIVALKTHFRTNRELEELHRKLIEIRDYGSYGMWHFSNFQQKYNEGALPNLLHAIVDLNYSDNPNDVLKTIWELINMGQDNFGINGTILAPVIPSNKSEYKRAMLEIDYYGGSQHSAHRLVWCPFYGEISRVSQAEKSEK